MTMKTKILKLITEATEPAEIVKEKHDPSKPFTMKFRGIGAVSEKKNANGRIYHYELLKQEIERYDKEMVQTCRALCELEHPSSCDTSPDRASARILSIAEDNKSWICEGVILCTDEAHNVRGTPAGDILASLTNYGTKWGLSTRALGDVNESTGYVTDLQLCAIDTVTNPSCGELVNSNGDRFVNGILESKQFVCNIHGEIIEEKFNKFEKSISKMPNTHISSKRNEKVYEALTEFFSSLRV